MKGSVESFLSKVEVMADSTTIIYSVRVLIIVIALLMGYAHTPKENMDVTSSKQTGLLPQSDQTLMNGIK